MNALATKWLYIKRLLAALPLAVFYKRWYEAPCCMEAIGCRQCVGCLRKDLWTKAPHLVDLSEAEAWAGATLLSSVMGKICLHMPRGTFQGLWRTSQGKIGEKCLDVSDHMLFKPHITGFSQSWPELLIITALYQQTQGLLHPWASSVLASKLVTTAILYK